MRQDAMAEAARQFLDALREDAFERARRASHLPPSAPAQGPSLATGQVWTAEPPDEARALTALVVLRTVEPHGVHGYLAFEEPAAATTDDILVESFESPTGQTLVVARWRPLWVRREQLGEYLGELGALATDVLLALEQGGARGICVGHDRLSDIPVVCWQVADPGTGEGLPYLTGTRALAEDDPRLEVRQTLRELTDWLGGERMCDAEELDAPEAPDAPDAIFARIFDALRQRPAEVVAQRPLAWSPFPVLDLGLGAAFRGPGQAQHPPSGPSGVQEGREFSLACGRVTASFLVVPVGNGLEVKVHARSADGSDVPDVQVMWTSRHLVGELGGGPIPELVASEPPPVWQATTNAEGLARSPRLTLRQGALHELTVRFEGVAASLKF